MRPQMHPFICFLKLRRVYERFVHPSYEAPKAERLINPATYSCHNDEREYAAEWLLNGVRVGEENLLEPLRLA